MLDAIIVEEPTPFKFRGTLSRSEAEAVWNWLARDIAPDLIDPASPSDPTIAFAALEAITPILLARARQALADIASDVEAERRLRTMLGGGDIGQRVPAVLDALKYAPLLGRAQSFGRAVNGIPEDDALAAALQAMPRQNPEVAAVVMAAAIRHVSNPGRLVIAATTIAGGASESALLRAGFGPLVDALLARAQNTVPPLLQVGPFADMDLICRAVDRFHRLIRAIQTNVELDRPSRWGAIIGALTKTISSRLEPKLRDLVPDLNRSLRRQRDGIDWLDSDGLLAALNGCYLLETVRDCRDSLALNEVFDETWTRTGQLLEMHLPRNLETLRANRNDEVAAARLDSGIKMAALRFGNAYAQVLYQAKAAALRH